MAVATRKRPRRLVLVAAGIALSAAVFAAVQAPLQAGSPPRLIVVVNGHRYDITRGQLEENADLSGPFTQQTTHGGRNTVQTDKAISLHKLLEVAGTPADTKF